MKKILVSLVFVTFIVLNQNCFSQETWTATSMVNAPSARGWHTAVWTGSKIIIWGGEYSNTGGIFDPAANSWVATSTSNAPQGRGEHSAVWTGTKMIVWGGATPANYFNSGGKYDPMTDQWTPTSTVNAPSPRYFHKAVWTGDKMIVWGGYANNIVYNTGGKYDPVTDSWASTSTANVPTERYLHSCIWTGSKMIAWGGCSANGLTSYNTGGIYDPVNDTWTPISTINAPSARCSHTATWTGNKMIIWGGVIGQMLYANNGGIYDPVTDSWQPITTGNAPEGRAYHTANWTGTKLIVWGGITNLQVNTGGIYDPVTNSWTATTISNAPEPREYHSGIWTGSKLFVWGGMHLGNSLNTGGIYSNPSVISVQNISENVPVKFSLYQNYPNPFNPVTKIRFDLPKSDFVTFKIYDILGSEVITLINEQLMPGVYEAEWNASNFASGIYYYRITSGDFSEVKKMILIK